jgi:hypothetical protein
MLRRIISNCSNCFNFNSTSGGVECEEGKRIKWYERVGKWGHKFCKLHKQIHFDEPNTFLSEEKD